MGECRGPGPQGGASVSILLIFSQLQLSWVSGHSGGGGQSQA